MRFLLLLALPLLGLGCGFDPFAINPHADEDTPAQATPNVPPVAVIGEPQFDQSLDTVHVDGRASSDPDGWIESWRWFGDEVLIGSGSILVWHGVPRGSIVLTLVVTDNDGADAYAWVEIVRPNVPPVAIARPLVGDGPDEVLSGLAIDIAMLSGRDSYDPDGSIASWDWFVGTVHISSGAALLWNAPPIGVSIVTLAVTDDQGAQATDEIRVVQPGFRPGKWQGLTSQGYSVEFEIRDFAITAAAFGFEYEGYWFNGPCRYATEREQCTGTGCGGIPGPCEFHLLWGFPDAYVLDGSCVEVGDPPFEHARGTAEAIVQTQNCCCGPTGITWEAWWVSE